MIVYDLNKSGIKLEEFLENEKTKIKGKRCFYIISTNTDNQHYGVSANSKRVYKIGISDSNHSRLQDYVHFYGYSNTSQNHGAMLHYLYCVKKNKRVEFVNSEVYKKERKIKQAYKNSTKKIKRGSERLFVTWANLSNYIKTNKKFIENEDIETPQKGGLKDKHYLEKPYLIFVDKNKGKSQEKKYPVDFDVGHGSSAQKTKFYSRVDFKKQYPTFYNTIWLKK